MPPARRVAVTAFVAFASLVLAGCITGERPRLDDSEPAPDSLTGDPAIDAVLTRLDTVNEGTFTAGYQVLTRFGELMTDAVVAQQGTDRRSVTIGTTRYIDGRAERARTCDLTAGTCADGLDDTKAAAVLLTREFFGASAATRLRRDAQGVIGETASYTKEIAGQSATCVDLEVTGGRKTYCALDTGVLALQDGADTLIQLVSMGPAVDPSSYLPL